MRSENGKLFWVSYADLMTALFIIALALFVLSYKMFNIKQIDLSKAEDELKLRSLSLVNAEDALKLREEEIEKQNLAYLELQQRLSQGEQMASSLIQDLNSERDRLVRLEDQLKKERGRLVVMEEEYKKLQEIQKAIENLDSRYFVYQPEFKRHVLRGLVQFPKGESEIPAPYHPMLYQAGNALASLINRLEPDDNIKYMLIIEGMASRDAYSRNYELSYERALSLVRLWEEKGITFDHDRFEVMIAGSGEGGIGRDRTNEKRNQRFLIQIIPKIGELNAIEFDYGK